MLAYVKSRSITSVMLNSKDEWRAITLETSDLAFINDPLHSPMISTIFKDTQSCSTEIVVDMLPIGNVACRRR